MRVGTLFITAVALFSAAPVALLGQTQPAPFTITITAGRPELPSGAETRVQIVVMNNSSESITVPGVFTGRPEYHYLIDVRNEKGQPASLTAWGRMVNGPFGSTGSMGGGAAEPGKPYKDSDLIVNKLYDITMPGKYTVQLTADWLQYGSPVKSNVVTIVVTP
jgi:hypothetical protein